MKKQNVYVSTMQTSTWNELADLDSVADSMEHVMEMDKMLQDIDPTVFWEGAALIDESAKLMYVRGHERMARQKAEQALRDFDRRSAWVQEQTRRRGITHHLG